MMTMTKKMLAVAVLAGVIGVAGCASRDPGAAAQAEAPAVAVPASSPLSKIAVGMNDVDVRKAIGEPTTSRSYMTGKAWIPYYYGSDTSRTSWTYAGEGEVVFSRNRYSGGLKVIRVDYNPNVQVQ